MFNCVTEILSVSGLAVTSATASTNTATGALVVSGGLGLVGNAFIGGTVTAPLFTGNLSATAATAIAAAGVKLQWVTDNQVDALHCS